MMKSEKVFGAYTWPVRDSSMAGDSKSGDRESFGKWFREQMQEAVLFEKEPWAIDRVRRVEERLQAGRPAADRFVVEIPWLEEVTAFTVPGRYIYVSRRLYEQFMTDEQVAFVIAHEMAHHDLEHIDVFAGWADKIAALPGSALFAKAFHVFEWRLYGPEKECDADRHALDLCLAAGYDGNRALEVFDILEHHALDMRDLDIVFSPDTESDDDLEPDTSWLSKARTWIWQRTRGYLPIRDRREMLLKHLRMRTEKQSEREQKQD